MASEEKKLPNLKICIDNDGDKSDTEQELGIKIEEEIEGDPEPETETGLNPTEEANLFSEDRPASARSGKNKPHKEIRKYENKSGEFVTGIELTSEEQLAMREKRAKRFGISTESVKAISEDDIKALYSRLGFSEKVSDERGIRPEAIHLRGVENMSTGDVFKYFDKYSPGEIEWIDDSSCNVVWMDKLSAARAMLALSRSPDSDVSDDDGDGDGDKRTESMEVTPTEPQRQSSQSAEKSKETEENMEDDDELNLLSSSSDEEEGGAGDSKAHKKAEKPSKTLSTQPSHESKVPLSSDKPKKKRKMNIIVPPGKWRVGKPSNRSGFLFLRFATKADHKLPGAEKKSSYYRKYGNPNYGGMTGFISQSRKQRMNWDDRKSRMEARDIINSRNQIDEEEEYYLSLESEGLSMFDIHLREAQSRLRKQQRKDEEEKLHKQAEERKKTQKRKKTGSDSSDESDVEIDEDIAALLRPPPVKRYMRMYADDVEEESQGKQSKSYKGAISVTAKSGIHSRLSGDYVRYHRSPSGDEEEEDEEDQEFADEYRSSRISGDLRRRLNRPRVESRSSTTFRPRDLKRLRVEVEQD